ncbi:hypothetical protein Lesp02_27610 [Lentzea sp. NBRC 105346]|uniref:maleylpyruvate isomerase family mycothiol-dependent enzyme n=1 Tax=Lentzea sp. NBRC 105346 TaxID=3032205 RepID=UPI00255244DD|nr:maleylpyruvate isomerase family mycothiol-dependent enzyme [Lentzea sp. NBRC 105346]GLZ30572.1 hypothetical protein Lesp02_27610 [Lentzea sp. NBRC 105346]
MDRDEVWQEINAHRERVVAMLEALSQDEWTQPSLCDGWTVRDVAGHLAWQNTARPLALLPAMIRARGNMDRLIRDESVRWARRPIPQLITDVRALIGTRKKPPVVTHLEQLIDILVHSQDIAVPLDRQLPLSAEAAATAASRVMALGVPWYAAKKYAGLRFAATDTSWTYGDGPTVEGPIDAILLVLTGRPVALPRLSGAGVADLTARVS